MCVRERERGVCTELGGCGAGESAGDDVRCVPGVRVEGHPLPVARVKNEAAELVL